MRPLSAHPRSLPVTDPLRTRAHARPDSPLLADPDLKKIADAHACHPAKILISYQIARGVVVLPKSVTPARIASNLETVDLTANELATLNGLAESKGKTQRVNTPLFGTDLGFDDWYNKAA